MSPSPGCGKKRPPSPATPPSDGEDSSSTSTANDDGDRWALSDDENGEENGEDQWTCRPFTVDDFPRVSSDHGEQSDAVYGNSEILLRSPSPLRRIHLSSESVHSSILNSLKVAVMGAFQRIDSMINLKGMAPLSPTSPARGICMTSHVLFEFKLCIWTEDGPKQDLLIEGCAEFINMLKTEPFIENRRLYGEKCGLDLKFVVLINAVQAKVDIEILCAPACGLNLKLYAKTSGFILAETICHGTVGKVVKPDEFTTISVMKVTWKAVES